MWTSDAVDQFQVILLSMYLTLSAVLLALLWLNCREQYILSHFVPAESSVEFALSDNSILRKVTDHYYGMTVVLIRRAIVHDVFGPDLAPIILSYLPAGDHYEDAVSNIAKPKIVI